MLTATASPDLMLAALPGEVGAKSQQRRASHLILVSRKGNGEPDDAAVLTDRDRARTRQGGHRVITELPHAHGLQLRHRDHHLPVGWDSVNSACADRPRSPSFDLRSHTSDWTQALTV
jgi:hypothetical protein